MANPNVIYEIYKQTLAMMCSLSLVSHILSYQWFSASLRLRQKTRQEAMIS